MNIYQNKWIIKLILNTLNQLHSIYYENSDSIYGIISNTSDTCDANAKIGSYACVYHLTIDELYEFDTCKYWCEL